MSINGVTLHHEAISVYSLAKAEIVCFFWLCSKTRLEEMATVKRQPKGRSGDKVGEKRRAPKQGSTTSAYAILKCSRVGF